MIKEMKYFYTLYQRKSFSKAAEDLFITQPTLSLTIKRLEQEVGVPLFDRSTTPIEATEEGEVYARAAEKVLRIDKELRDYFFHVQNLDVGHIRIGSTVFYCSYSLPLHLKPFIESHHGIDLGFEEYNDLHAMERDLKKGKLDFVLTNNHDLFRHFRKLFFKDEHLILAVPADYPINRELVGYRLTFDDVLRGGAAFTEKPGVPLGKFDGLPYLSLRQGSDLFDRAQELFGRAGIHPEYHMFLDQMPTLYYLASYGYGYAIIRASTLRIVPRPQGDRQKLIFYRIDDPLAVRDVSFYYRAGEELTPVVSRFIQYTEEKVRLGQVE